MHDTALKKKSFQFVFVLRAGLLTLQKTPLSSVSLSRGKLCSPLRLASTARSSSGINNFLNTIQRNASVLEKNILGEYLKNFQQTN